MNNFSWLNLKMSYFYFPLWENNYIFSKEYSNNLFLNARYLNNLFFEKKTKNEILNNYLTDTDETLVITGEGALQTWRTQYGIACTTKFKILRVLQKKFQIVFWIIWIKVNTPPIFFA